MKQFLTYLSGFISFGAVQAYSDQWYFVAVLGFIGATLLFLSSFMFKS